jgi:hemolysin activation/secretion protein
MRDQRRHLRVVRGAVLGGLTLLLTDVAAVNLVPERMGDDRTRSVPAPPKEHRTPPRLTVPEAVPSDRDDKRLSKQIRVFIKRIVIRGNTVFRSDELSTVTRAYEQRSVGTDELQSLRRELTLYYVERGYLNSGAVIPDQKVRDGTVAINVVEGRLSEVEVSGNKALRPSYIVDRMNLGTDGVLNLTALQERLQLLQQDPLIERISADLTPGLKPGEASLFMHITERQRYAVGLSMNNHRSPSVGALGGTVWGTLYNLTGFGDILETRYSGSEGLDAVAGAYTLPLNAHGTLLRVTYDQNDATVTEQPFDTINITSATHNGSLAIEHPFILTPRTRLKGELRFERRHSETFLLDSPFSFSPGTQDGVSDISVLRLTQDWSHRTLHSAIGLRSTLNLGLDLFGATINSSDLPDGQFFSWVGQFQWARRLSKSNHQVIFRTDLQLAADPLLPLEKFALGGANSVRGYRENAFVRDNGWVSSIEFRLPVARLPLTWLSDDADDGWLQLAPFFDIGWSEDIVNDSQSQNIVYSAGLGLRWDPASRLHAEFYWGHGFVSLEPQNVEHDLQDDGLHFRLDLGLL